MAGHAVLLGDPAGGLRIARAIRAVVDGHDFTRGRAAVFTESGFGDGGAWGQAGGLPPRTRSSPTAVPGPG